jgi:hypothetical protein
VAVYGTYLSIVGPGYRGGKEFYYGELPIVSSSGVRQLDLRDMSGDGKDEIVLRIRRGGDEQYREILQVLDIGSDGAPSLAFAHEVAIKTDDVLIENEVSVSGSGNNAKIVVSQGEAKGVDPGSYSEPIPSDMPSTLLPWESVKRRTFEWKGGKMEQTDEESWKPKLDKPSGARAARARSSGPPAPPPPRPPSADEMLERVYALYRKDRGVGHSKPRFDFVTDVIGDRTPERVLVHGKDIVIFGKGFREGRSYAFIQVGVGKPDDIVDVTARDLTGDGKAEVILRAVMQAKASKELGGDTVERYAVLVYKVQGSELVRVFGAEMGRALGKDRILGAIAFEPQQRGFAIELRAARAIGWTEKTYPFPPDTTAAGGLEPLLLPWGPSSVRRYRYDGKNYAQQ